MQHAVIVAGGVGSRLWPMSRQDKPKQFQKLIGERTLIQQTYDRIIELIDPKNVWVMTGQNYVGLVKEQLPNLENRHIIAEPTGRNTAPATLLATLSVLDEDPEAVLFGLLPADHYVGKPVVFTKISQDMLEFIGANPDYVGTIGIYPTEPNTGYGYIKKGSELEEINGQSILTVESFHEKPDLKTAKKFLNSGRYLWNGGYYLFNGARMVEYYQELSPTIFTAVAKYRQTQDPKDYEQIPAEPIDKSIAEKLDKLAVISADMHWSDIGNWATLHQILAERGETSEVIIGNHIGNSSENTLIMGGSKLIVTVGLKDVVVVDTDDVILVCNKSAVQDVKKIVDELSSQGNQRYL